MNRIDRLFNLLLLLQARKHMRAQDIARYFEISERTVYRDVSALMQMGVPILSAAGEGYTLDEFFMPPLMFTAEEAVALYLGISLLKATGNLTAEAAALEDKLGVALPGRTRRYAEQQASIVQFLMPRGQYDLNTPHLRTLWRAIVEQRVVYLEYFSYSENEHTQREVEAYELSYGSGAWYLNGYCRLRQGMRAFRLDRIEKLTLRPDRFEKREMAEPETPEHVAVAARFHQPVVRWVRERQHYAFQREQLEENGAVLMVYQVKRLSEITAWLLSWGAQVEVLEPPALRRQMRDEAQQLLNLLT